MTDDTQVISRYTDGEALEDGALVEIHGEAKVNRVTRAVFDHFVEAIGSSSLTGPVLDITPLKEVIRSVLKVPPDEDGWRTLDYQGKTLWLVPNEVRGLTLKFPDHY